MKSRTWIVITFAALFAISLLAGCSNAPANAPAKAAIGGGAQIANPWKDGTPEEAAAVLGGTFYNITTLGKDYEQYALLVSTDDAVKNGSLQPAAWVRYKKGDADVSLQMSNGGKLSADQLKGTKVSVNGTDAHITDNGDDTTQITWEANGILFQIGTSAAWNQADLISLADGVKASK